jgi:hypothetical protein
MAKWGVTLVESPDPHLYDKEPGLFDVNVMIETLTTTFDRRATAMEIDRGIENPDEFGPYVLKALRKISVEPTQHRVSLRVLNPDTTELNGVADLGGQQTPFVCRLARHGARWLVTRETLQMLLQIADSPPT